MIEKNLSALHSSMDILSLNWVSLILLKIEQTYKPHNLEGPTVTRPVQDPLAVNTLTTDYIFVKSIVKKSLTASKFVNICIVCFHRVH